MREVYESRATWVEHEKRNIAARKDNILQERKQVEDELNRQRQEMEEEALKRRLMGTKH
jgi:cell division protein FtsL